MAVFLIGYDLKAKPEEDYEELFEAIRKLDKSAWHELDSTWLIRSELSAGKVRDALSSHLFDDDKLLVLEITSEAAWATHDLSSAAKWLRASA